MTKKVAVADFRLRYTGYFDRVNMLDNLSEFRGGSQFAIFKEKILQ